MDNEKLIDNIKNICKNNNITVTKLEEELGMSQGLVSRWTKSDPSLSRIVDIADYFNISLDEVVGYHNIIDDRFLEKLITQTVNKTIKWNKYNPNDENNPKMFSLHFDDFFDEYDYYKYCETHKQISYYVKINNSYISIYGSYEYQNIVNPSDIKLFIQPDENSDLVEQLYDDSQLKTLWLKVLYSLGEKAPDEIKAEEFKNAFINDFDKPKSTPKKKTILIVAKPNDPNSPKNYRNTQQIRPTPKPLPIENDKNNDNAEE